VIDLFQTCEACGLCDKKHRHFALLVQKKEKIQIQARFLKSDILMKKTKKKQGK
jgi:hypothetical protein